MDYVVGSVAALVSGNVTPNRPRILKRALTPTKHQPSPNVTPKSEFVDDRSIFLSPTLQKKKAIVKKSPKRIFQNPDLDVTSEGDGNSGKAEKVKKHLKEKLDSEKMVIKSPGKQKNAIEMKTELIEGNSPKKKIKNIEAEEVVTENTQAANESTPKKKKKLKNSMSNTPEMAKDQKTNSMDTKTEGTPKKIKKEKSLKLDTIEQENKEINTKVSPKIETVPLDSAQSTPKKKKKNRKRNKNVIASQPVSVPEKSPDEQGGPQISKKKRKLSKSVDNEPNSLPVVDETVRVQNTEPQLKKKNKRKKKSKQAQKVESDQNIEIQNQVSTEDIKPKKKKSNKNIVNPNAITNEDTDSEHESDDEINSETEEANNEIFNDGMVEESSGDDEEDGDNEINTVKKKERPKKTERTEINIQEEINRTLFVGNVMYSPNCKKELKKIFAHYGIIDTIRFRAIPIKDARLTPKVAAIKNELHPERSTVNAYIKYRDAESVDKALVENNTLFKDKHLRVTRSDSTGDTHDPKASVFVGNLPFALEDEAFREKFERCGEIDSVRIVRDKKTNIGKGFGYVNFASKDAVELALSLTEEDLTIKNRILRVKRCTHTNKPHDRPPNQTINSQRASGFNNRESDFNNKGRDFNNRGRGFNNRGRDFNNRGRDFNNRGRGFNSRGGRGISRGEHRSFNDRGDFNSRGGSRGRGGQRGGSGFSSRGGQRTFSNSYQDGQTQGYQQGRSDKNDIGAFRRIQNKRQHQDGGNEGPPSKRPKEFSQPGKEKKARKEFVGMTAEKKKKRKNSKSQGLRQKKALSEILSK